MRNQPIHVQMNDLIKQTNSFIGRQTADPELSHRIPNQQVFVYKKIKWEQIKKSTCNGGQFLNASCTLVLNLFPIEVVKIVSSRNWIKQEKNWSQINIYFIFKDKQNLKCIRNQSQNQMCFTQACKLDALVLYIEIAPMKTPIWFRYRQKRINNLFHFCMDVKPTESSWAVIPGHSII